MGRVYNFSAGPSMLPEEVLKIAQQEMLDYRGTGMSVMEMSHRSKAFDEIIKEAASLLKTIMNIPQNYRVLFLQGGASTQFTMVPLNLFRKSKSADYVNTGSWSTKAIKEAARYGKVHVVASSEDKNYTYIPKLEKDMFDPDADYVHITTNNTIYGTRYTSFPDSGAVPLVADMSSNILSEGLDVSQFGLIYAGAQKNIAPAGLTVVIIREDLIGHAMDITPTMLDYKIHADKDSLYNTPPCYCIYIALLVFKWLLKIGGIAEMEKINREKATLLYDVIDNSKLYRGTARSEDRSIMNVTFVLPSDELNQKFVKESEKEGFVSLKGHRSVGGLRASIYNAVPLEGVKKLIDFMKQFELQNR
ncbi:MAG: MFS transporter [Spirochaetes bacterium DG_61]|nr:MAG: MFS transporter [Spirochaetes bacterium DG_61]